MFNLFPNMPDERKYGLAALGMGMSQLAAGQPVNLQPAMGAMMERKQRADMKRSLQESGVLDRFTPEQRAILASMPPNAAQQVIASVLFREPEPAPKPIEVNGQLVDPRTYEVLGDYRTPEAPKPNVTLVGPGDPSRTTFGLPDDGRTYEVEYDPQTMQVLDYSMPGGAGTNVTTNVDMGGDVWNSETAKWASKWLGSLAEQGAQASAEIGQIEVISDLLAQGDIGGTADAWKSWAQNAFGVSISGGKVEALNAAISKLVPQQRPPGSGEMSDSDLKLFKESLPQLVNSPEGNQIIVETMRGLAEYKRAQGEVAAQALLGRMTRKEALEAIYALPDPLAAARERIKALSSDLPDEEARRRALEAVQGVLNDG